LGKTLSNILSIPKSAQTPAHFRRSAFGFRSAREGFHSLLSAWDITAADSILLPSFIGWSAREGSGVLDPIAHIGAEPIFYRMTRDLSIDAYDVQRKIRERQPRVLVLIHYFGYPDPNTAALAEYAREHGVLVVEDEAHAMLSDLVGGICGRAGDAVVFSLHKILPFREGGVLLLNPSIADSVRTRLEKREAPLEPLPFWEYDLHRIADLRRRNATQLMAALPGLANGVQLLFPNLPPGVVPQTLPVVIRSKNRNNLYVELNDAGVGVVSLYHTLIDSISASEFPESHVLASCIMNLPVHQDVEPCQLDAMVGKLQELV
jgi:dTDP-4-amino-4,6-dideoxygalactose transaminase